MKKMNHCTMLGALFLAATTTMTGMASADGHGDAGEIADVLRSYEGFVNDGDATGLGSLYTEDAVLLPDRFDVFEGNEAITGFYAFAFSALTLELEFQIDPDDIVVDGGTAYATTSSTGTRFIKEANQTVPEINRELWVFERVDDAWKIARYAFNKSE
ncbi:MAG: nuclear transport factor 2 family protein [Pseudomonadota bacterium]